MACVDVGVHILELLTGLHKMLQCPEKAPTSLFSLKKAPTSPFTIYSQ